MHGNMYSSYAYKLGSVVRAPAQQGLLLSEALMWILSVTLQLSGGFRRSPSRWVPSPSSLLLELHVLQPAQRCCSGRDWEGVRSVQPLSERTQRRSLGKKC